MARTPAQRGKIGNWLVDNRLDRGWSTQERARQEIERLAGWRIPQSVYAEWESGRRVPSDENLERLEAFYGLMPGREEPRDQSADVIAALARVEKALDRQTESLEHQWAEMRGAVDGLADSLMALLARLASEHAETEDAPVPLRAGRG